MYLAKNNIVPPIQFKHYSTLQNTLNDTVAVYLELNKLQVPQEWKYDSKYRLGYNNTTAMYIAENKIIPPDYWNHDPNLQNNDGNTVAMLLIKNKIFNIPKQWEHNPYIANKDEMTMQDYFVLNNIDVPKQWKIIDKQIQITDEIQQQLKEYCRKFNIKNQQIVINYPQYQKDFFNYTFAIYLEINNIYVPKEFLYDPSYILLDGRTSAMCIVDHKKIPSQYWNHSPLITDKHNNTVATWLAYRGFIPSKEWYHDPQIQNKYGRTVAIYLSQNGIIPPNQWSHDINMENNKGESIRQNLLKYNYFYINNQFIKLTTDNIKQYFQTRIIDGTCQICFEEDQQYLIKTTCTHKICLYCFIEIIKANNYKNCPVCRQEQWFQLINQDQQ